MENRLQSKAFQKLAETAAIVANPETDAWKENGGNIIGYFCAAMPVELITAAGFLPFRLRATGSTNTDLSDVHLSSLNCTFPRHAFNLAMEGKFDFLDGLIFFNSCDHIRRAYDHWIRRIDTPFVKILSLPKKAEAPQVEWFTEELTILRDQMQAHFGVEITDDNIRKAIKLHNETRKLLRELYDLRRADNPPITGSESLTVTVAGTALPPELYNSLLRELLNDLKQADGISDYKARLIVLGGECDNPDYIKVIEDQGGLVVADALCFGSRLLWKDVDETINDPLTALAQYSVADRPSCARMYAEYQNRAKLIKEIMTDFNVGGAIFERLTFCEIWGFEQLNLTNTFKDWKVPLLCLDREYILSGVGQLKTRVQALLETIGG